MGELEQWCQYLLRWAHLIAGISWIGNSFYFMWLDAHLVPPDPPRDGATGELWMVHSGGFYRVEKRRIGPGSLPAVLHWFRWEAALTLATGVLLLGLVYYGHGAILLLDPAVEGLSAGGAAALGILFLAASWLAYDTLWRSPLGRNALLAGAASAALFCAATCGLSRLFSGRGAYVHLGAALGTIMVLNVWLRILPAQRDMIRATQAGRSPDPALSAGAKRRSVHNSYITLPVLFLMVSNHFPMTYGHRLGWIIAILLAVVGMSTRHVMIVGRRGLWVAVPGIASLALLLWLTAHP